MIESEFAGTPHERVDVAAHAELLVHDQREIARLLQVLTERSNLVTAYLDDKESFLTVVLGLTADQRAVLIDASPDARVNQRAADAEELVCVTRLDRVKMQFSLHAATLTSFRERPALLAKLPESLLRLQRREYFRVPAPQADPLTCSILLRQPDGSHQAVNVRVLDLSGGGVAIIVPPEGIGFAPGDEFERCTLELPDGEPIQVRLCVRNLFSVEKANGHRLQRAGCQFLGLSNAASARIQRYLFRLERDYRARFDS